MKTVNNESSTSTVTSKIKTDEKATVDESEQIAIRKEKLVALRTEGEAYPNTFRRNSVAATLHTDHNAIEKEDLATKNINVKIAGRMLTRRVMGKASFCHLLDMSGKMQAYVQRDSVGVDVYTAFKKWDIGDILGIEGVLFKTKTGELSVKATAVFLLTKALRPLPDKYHGLADREQRYRQRYLDLISNDTARKTFLARSKTVSCLRTFLEGHDFLEVETPMMHSIPGGAIARPFVTHHNSLGKDLYLRIAPELYLKRLLVGGFERVYEINRNFRNEGLSTRHNPEFTMLEYYQAYADYLEAMDLLETMICEVAQNVLGQLSFDYDGQSYDLTQPFTRISVIDAILKYNPTLKLDNINTLEAATSVAASIGIATQLDWGTGKIQIEIFEKTVESKLMDPTFITGYPTEVSPLARVNADDPAITDRFELFIGGQEIANGFSELNDPVDQAQRFAHQAQTKNSGDDEAMHYDEDYILALEFGMPPAAGVGIGIDRLVMLLTDSPAIRDVILFPHLRDKAKIKTENT